MLSDQPEFISMHIIESRLGLKPGSRLELAAIVVHFVSYSVELKNCKVPKAEIESNRQQQKAQKNNASFLILFLQ